MICTPCMLRILLLSICSGLERWYDRWWCVHHACKKNVFKDLYWICNIFIEIIDNKKLEEGDEVDDDVYTLHVKRLAIKYL
jgi:hypothetical protein